MSIGQYIRFLCVGGFVGLITIAARQLIAMLFSVENAWNFSVSVTVAYTLGIALSYFLNHRFTFRDGTGSYDLRRLSAFVTVACIGLVTTWLLSIGIRHEFQARVMMGKYASTAAFVIATLLASAVVYPLNALWVFGVRSGRIERGPAG